MSVDSGKRYTGCSAILAGLVATLSMSAAVAAPLGSSAEDMARESWRETITRTPVPYAACFTAVYPNPNWAEVACVEAPDRVYVPRSGTARSETVGDGKDYAATVTGLMSSAVGSFPVVTGVKTERDGRANVYSIQLNSNFMSGTAACNGISGCLSWSQFVYSSSEKSAFMQYWLIGYGSTCPSKAWHSYSNDCYKNSAAVSVPQLPIGDLSGMTMSGSAVLNGNDTLVFTTPTQAYSTSGADTVTDLATAWTQAEFNIIGDGGGSSAVFNKGSSITVKIAVANGTTTAPSCTANAGTTGETNNLTLGACTTAGGSPPYVQFVESK